MRPLANTASTTINTDSPVGRYVPKRLLGMALCVLTLVGVARPLANATNISGTQSDKKNPYRIVVGGGFDFYFRKNSLNDGTTSTAYWTALGGIQYDFAFAAHSFYHEGRLTIQTNHLLRDASNQGPLSLKSNETLFLGGYRIAYLLTEGAQSHFAVGLLGQLGPQWRAIKLNIDAGNSETANEWQLVATTGPFAKLRYKKFFAETAVDTRVYPKVIWGFNLRVGSEF